MSRKKEKRIQGATKFKKATFNGMNIEISSKSGKTTVKITDDGVEIKADKVIVNGKDISEFLD